jgi:TolB-like protein/Flp pilus assembly protein TadD
MEEQADEYLGLGLADVLITQLGNTGGIVVRPTSSVLRYADAPTDSISAGAELGVDAVVEGSVQRAGRRLRVTVQMVSVRDGVALWADKFNAEFTDIFAVQDSISEQVASALSSKLPGEKRERLRKRYTESTEAYQSYLKGRYCWNKRNVEGFRKAMEHFRVAIEIDPTFALAFAGLSDTYVPLASWGEQSSGEALPRARAAAERALEIDEDLCEAHTSLGNVLYGLWDLAGAEIALRRAIELNPNYPTAHNRYAQVLTSLMRFDQALVEIGRAQQLDPLSAIINTAVGAPYFYARQYDRAIQQYRKVFELDPDFVPALFSLGSALSQQGMFEESLGTARRVVELTGNHPLMSAHLANMYAAAGRRDEALAEIDSLVSGGRREVLPYALSLVYARLGDRDWAMSLLDEAYRERSTHLHDLMIDPEFDLLRSDPRFKDLLRQVGLTPA